MEAAAYLEMAQTEAKHWWFAGRRAIATRLIGNLGLPPGARILEIGCGTGGNLDMLMRHGKVDAMEYNAVARGIAQEKCAGRVDVRPGHCPDDIPFTARTYDLICLFDVLEHIDEEVDTLKALKTLLAPGGVLLLTVPAMPWMWSTHDEYLHHKRRYTAGSLRSAIESAGLRTGWMSYFNTLLFPLAACARAASRLTDNKRSHGTGLPPAPINALLKAIFSAEGLWLKGGRRFPFGVSLAAVVRAD